MTKLEQAARQALPNFKKLYDKVMAAGNLGHQWTGLKLADDCSASIGALFEALDHSADTSKMVVPNGYALVSIDALKAWGKYDEVRNACQFPAEQAEQEPGFYGRAAARLSQRVKELELEQSGKWRDHVEHRMLTWKTSHMNESGDQLSLKDFMDEHILDDLIDFVCDEYTAPVEQEPVAYQIRVRPHGANWLEWKDCSKSEYEKVFGKPSAKYHDYGARKLYTHPVRTKDLTDDEAQKLWNDTSSIVPMWAHHLHFARAVIAADREKNK